MALTEAIKEALWLLELVKELKLEQVQISVYCDNQGIVQLSKNKVFHERTKDIDIKLHSIRDVIAEGSVAIKKASAEETPADMITKPLPSSKSNYYLELVGVMDTQPL